MTDKAYNDLVRWGSRIVVLAVLASVLITIFEIMFFNIPQVRGLGFTQGVGVMIAGLAYFLHTLQGQK